MGASRIYLLLDEKDDSWGKEATRHADIVKTRLMDMALDQEDFIEVGFDPTNYQSCQDTIQQILQNEEKADTIYLNISSSTKLCAVAFALSAMEYNNTYLYYVVPKEYNIPKDGAPFSFGAKRVEVFSPRIVKFGDYESEILKILDNNEITSLRDLNEIINPEDIGKAERAKLSYFIRKLEKVGFVSFIPGERIALTPLGKSKLHPPIDDAIVTS